MKCKYQSSLFRSFAASGLAAVFSAGAFSNYGWAVRGVALNDIVLSEQSNEEEKPNVKVYIKNNAIELNNIKRSEVSERLELDIRGSNEFDEACKQIKFIDKNYSALGNSNVWDFLKCCTLTLYYDQQVNLKDVLKAVDFSFPTETDCIPKKIDLAFFLLREYVKIENSFEGFCKNYNLNPSFHNKHLLNVLSEHFFEFYCFIVKEAELYIKNNKKLRKKLRYYGVLIAAFIAAPSIATLIAYIIAQFDTNDSKQESTDKNYNSTETTQNPIDKKQNSKGKIQNPAGENKNSTGKTHSTLIENNKSTNKTQEYTHEDREHENQGSTTNDSNKYPETDNGFGAKNLKVILPVASGITAAVGSNVAAGVVKHFSNKNRQK